MYCFSQLCQESVSYRNSPEKSILSLGIHVSLTNIINAFYRMTVELSWYLFRLIDKNGVLCVCVCVDTQCYDKIMKYFKLSQV